MESSEKVFLRETRVVSEEEFRETARYFARVCEGQYKAVTGPGRSGAVAAVYFSHLLKIPFIPYKSLPPKTLTPLLIVDTAMMSGRTLRKAYNFYMRNEIFCEYTWLYQEPPRVKFWYENIGDNNE